MQLKIVKKQDVAAINRWLKRQGAPSITLGDLPVRCFIVPGVACMGIRFIEGDMWLMDSLVTNPLVSSSTRHKALDALYMRLLAVPGVERVIGFTRHPDAMERAAKHGFKPVNQVILSYKRGMQ